MYHFACPERRKSENGYRTYQHDYGNDDRDIADNNTDLEKEYLEELENMEYGE